MAKNELNLIKIQNFSRNLKQALQDKGIDQSRLASDLGLSTSSISYYISGKFLPKHEPLMMIGKYLHLDPQSMLTDNPTPLYNDPLALSRLANHESPKNTSDSLRDKRRMLMMECMDIEDSDVDYALMLIRKLKEGKI